MKKFILVIAVVFMLCGCQKKSVLKIKVSNDGNVEYLDILSDGSSNKTDEFECDKVNEYVFNVISSIDENKVINTLSSDDNVDDKIYEAADAVLKKESHPVYELKVIDDNNDYYVFYKLNVNLNDPCILYKYSSNRINKICELNNVELLGIRG